MCIICRHAHVSAFHASSVQLDTFWNEANRHIYTWTCSHQAHVVQHRDTIRPDMRESVGGRVLKQPQGKWALHFANGHPLTIYVYILKYNSLQIMVFSGFVFECFELSTRCFESSSECFCIWIFALLLTLSKSCGNVWLVEYFQLTECDWLLWNAVELDYHD